MIPKYDIEYSLVREAEERLASKTPSTKRLAWLMPSWLIAMLIAHGLRARLDAKTT
jgi:hypothetical protein